MKKLKCIHLVYVPLDNEDKKEEMIEEKKTFYLKLSEYFTVPF